LRSLNLPAALFTKQQVHLQALLADMLLPLYQAAAAAAAAAAVEAGSSTTQQQQQQQVQLAVLSRVQGFVQALAAARSEQEQKQLQGLLKTAASLHAALPQPRRDDQHGSAAADACAAAASAAAAAAPAAVMRCCGCGAHISTHSSSGSSSSSSDSSSSDSSSAAAGVLLADLVDAPDAAELVGLDSLKLMLGLEAEQQQQQELHPILQQLLQEEMEGLGHGEALHNCLGFQTLTPEQCRLEYWRVCVDAFREQPSSLDPYKQLQGAADLHSMLQRQQAAGSSWERVQLRRLLQEHAGLSCKEAKQLAAVSCKLS
jgi:hypothetical protein